MKKVQAWLFLGTVFYFALGLVHIVFAWLGLLCMTIPFVLLFRSSKKVWCQKYCPRASLFSKCGECRSSPSRSTPKYFIHGNLKWITLAYFAVSMFFVVLSTVMVAVGNRPPMYELRFLLVFSVPFSLPQLLEFAEFPVWAVHFAYRMYSLMMTTTTIGLILSFVYKPRTWCVICPISTLSNVYIKSKR